MWGRLFVSDVGFEPQRHPFSGESNSAGGVGIFGLISLVRIQIGKEAKKASFQQQDQAFLHHLRLGRVAFIIPFVHFEGW